VGVLHVLNRHSNSATAGPQLSGIAKRLGVFRSARHDSSSWRLAKEMRQVAGLLIRCQEGDDNLSRAAALGSQTIFDLP
jgi:hypothetical protein